MKRENLAKILGRNSCHIGNRFMGLCGNWFVDLCGNWFVDLCGNRFVDLCGNRFVDLCGNWFVDLCGNLFVALSETGLCPAPKGSVSFSEVGLRPTSLNLTKTLMAPAYQNWFVDLCANWFVGA